MSEFDRLWAQHRPAAFRTALRVLRVREDAEECLVDIELRARRAYPEFRGTGPFGAWISAITRNVACSYSRALRRRREMAHVAWRTDAADPRYDGSVTHRAVELRSVIGDASAVVPQRAMRLLVMHYGDGLSYKEISAKEGMPVNAIRSHIYRAKQEIRAALGPMLI